MRIFVPRCSAELSGEAPDGFVVSFMPSILTSPPSEQELQRCLHHVRPRSPWSSLLAGSRSRLLPVPQACCSPCSPKLPREFELHSSPQLAVAASWGTSCPAGVPPVSLGGASEARAWGGANED